MATRTGSRARGEILDMLKADHRKAKKAFSAFETLIQEGGDDAEQCRMLVEQTCAELEVHATIEEELFYPAVRNAIDETDLVDEAEIEHQSLKMLIEKLKGLDVDDEKYAASFKVLGEYVKHHVKEEEGELFEQAQKAKLDWENLQQRMIERRRELMSGMGLSTGDPEDEDLDDDEEQVASGGSGRKRGKRSTVESQ